jgi:hypothetical protein
MSLWYGCPPPGAAATRPAQADKCIVRREPGPASPGPARGAGPLGPPSHNPILLPARPRTSGKSGRGGEGGTAKPPYPNNMPAWVPVASAPLIWGVRVVLFWKPAVGLSVPRRPLERVMEGGLGLDHEGVCSLSCPQRPQATVPEIGLQLRAALIGFTEGTASDGGAHRLAMCLSTSHPCHQVPRPATQREPVRIALVATTLTDPAAQHPRKCHWHRHPPTPPYG